ncbi:MAG: DoxX family protein [Candidatus Melainabacteria bacterium]|nr:DoxX family protein [Candidatus Melainabacteria bacterium]
MDDKKSRLRKFSAALKNIATVLAAIGFIFAGYLHFKSPSMYLEIMPDYLPFPLFLIYLSGVCEIAGGVGLLIPRVRRLASYGLIALLIAVFPANVNMAVNSIDFGMPHEILWWRLPFQLVFILWVFWCGRDR